MSRARQAILSAGMNNQDPAKVLAQANAVLMLQDSTTVTAVCGYIEPWTMRISYSTAGHPPPILAAANGSARMLEGSGPPLGATNESSYRTFYEQGSIDSMLVLYTDGLVEYARNVARGEERLLALVNSMTAARPADPAHYIFASIFAESTPRTTWPSWSQRSSNEAPAQRKPRSQRRASLRLGGRREERRSMPLTSSCRSCGE